MTKRRQQPALRVTASRACPPEPTVADVLAADPGAARLFIIERMACPGCPMAKFETIADVARNYRKSAQRLRAGLKKRRARSGRTDRRRLAESQHAGRPPNKSETLP